MSCTGCNSKLVCLISPAMSTTLSSFITKPCIFDLASVRRSTPIPYQSPRTRSLFCKSFYNEGRKRQPGSKMKAEAAAGTGTAKSPVTSNDERVKKVDNIAEFDEALQSAKNRLVVVEFAGSQSYQSKKVYPFMVDLSRTCNDVDFLLVMGDESEETKALCKREKVEKVPHFGFYKGKEKVHEEEGISGPDQLFGDVLYYGDNHSAVVQLHNREDVEKLIGEHKGNQHKGNQQSKLIILDVGLKHCGPCVKVYPTVLKLSKQMAEVAVFARMNGDENDSCMQFLKDMNVIEVPTFLFIRDGEIKGRYVGSGKGELIGEILRYQGVRVTY